MGLPALKAYKEKLEIPVPLALRVRLALPGPKATRAIPALQGLPGLREPLVPSVRLGRRVHKAFRATQVRLGLRAHKVTPGQRARLEPLVPRARKAFRAFKESRGRQDPPDPPDRRVQPELPVQQAQVSFGRASGMLRLLTKRMTLFRGLARPTSLCKRLPATILRLMRQTLIGLR